MKLKVMIYYLSFLGGFPFLVLQSYNYGFIYSDFTSLVFLVVLFEIFIGTLFFMHLIYNNLEKSVVIIPNPKNSLSVEERELIL
jgi:Trk-type K+ transport system membrane component